MSQRPHRPVQQQLAAQAHQRLRLAQTGPGAGGEDDSGHPASRCPAGPWTSSRCRCREGIRRRRSGRPGGARLGDCRAASQRPRPWSTGGKQAHSGGRHQPPLTPWRRHASRSSPEGHRGRGIPHRGAGGHVRGAAGALPGPGARGHARPPPCPPGSRRRRPRSPHLSGRPAASSVVEVSLQLPMRNQRLAEQHVAQGEVLSQAEYDRRFGVPQAQVDAVTTWLRARGLTVTSADRVAGAVGGPGLGRDAAARPAHHPGHGRPAGARAGWCPSRRPCCRPRSVSAPSSGWTPRP